MKTTKAVPEILKEYQDKHKLTQHEMAKLLQISQPTYNNWINDKAPIDPTKYYPIIAKVCQIDLAALIPPNATVNISNGSSPENNYTANALDIYSKYTANLEENYQHQKIENERLQNRITELETTLASVQRGLLN